MIKWVPNSTVCDYSHDILSKWGEEKVEKYILDTEEYNNLMKEGLN